MQHRAIQDWRRLNTLHRSPKNSVLVLSVIGPRSYQVVEVESQVRTPILGRRARPRRAHDLVEINAVKKDRQCRSADIECGFLEINCVNQSDFCCLGPRTRRVAHRLQLFEAGANQHFYALAGGGDSSKASQSVLLRRERLDQRTALIVPYAPTALA